MENFENVFNKTYFFRIEDLCEGCLWSGLNIFACIYVKYTKKAFRIKNINVFLCKKFLKRQNARLGTTQKKICNFVFLFVFNFFLFSKSPAEITFINHKSSA